MIINNFRAVLIRVLLWAVCDNLRFDESGSTHGLKSSHWLLYMNILNAMTLVQLHPGMYKMYHLKQCQLQTFEQILAKKLRY